MSADSAPSSKTNIFQSKLYTLIYCRHFRTYSRCAMFDWSGTVFRRRNVTRRPYYSIEEAKRTHPRFADCTSAVIRYLICVYASHFFAGRPYHFNQTLRTANKLKNGDNRWACFEKILVFDEDTESADIATNENILLLDEYSKVKLF